MIGPTKNSYVVMPLDTLYPDEFVKGAERLSIEQALEALRLSNATKVMDVLIPVVDLMRYMPAVIFNRCKVIPVEEFDSRVYNGFDGLGIWSCDGKAFTDFPFNGMYSKPSWATHVAWLEY